VGRDPADPNHLPGSDIELSRVLHASEAVTVHAPLPASGSARSVTRSTEVWDKGKAAVIVSETPMHGLALRHDRSVIEGLYAAGNVSGSVMGHTYPGRAARSGRPQRSVISRRCPSLGRAAMPIDPAAAIGTEFSVVEFS
jgi:FAD binding domain